MKLLSLYIGYVIMHMYVYVTVFWKTNLMVRNAEIHFYLYKKATLIDYPETPSI